MTKLEYDEAFNQLRTELLVKERELMKRYALSNNTVKIGDIVADSIGSVRVNKILFYKGIMGAYPSCVYEGNELKKDGTIKMSRGRDPKPEIRGVYQGNVKS